MAVVVLGCYQPLDRQIYSVRVGLCPTRTLINSRP